MGSDYDPFGDLTRFASRAWKMSRWSYQAGRNWRAGRVAREVEREFGPEVAQAVEAAIRNGQDYGPILDRARRAQAERAERDRLLANPPPLHGSAAWATPDELRHLLKGCEAFDTPSSILLGAYTDASRFNQVSFVHWDEDGHLLTIAPTRSGKAVTTIIPNLLRYRGSCVVLDPKGELYEATSAWRARTVGPVYRWAPFEEHDAAKLNHGFNPLAMVRSEQDARALAEQLFPRDPRAQEFFTEDAAAFVTALILFVKHEAPEAHRNLAVVHKLASQPMTEFRALIDRMARASNPSVRAAAANVAGKSGDRGLPNLRDTLHTKFARWGAPGVLASLRRHDLDFEALKDRPATIYLDVPFDLMQPYAPIIRVVLKAALDAMLRNRNKPAIPVLFVLDEFLQLGSFPEFRDAIRTHAGAGLRLWFFLQDVAGIEEQYPNGWKPFFNCSVRQFFGVDDPDTAELVGRFLGTGTVAYRVTNAGSNTSAQGGGGIFGTPGSANVTFSDGESVQFAARPLLTPDEVMTLLSGWKGSTRAGVIRLRGPRPFQVTLSAVSASPTCRERMGMVAV